MLRAVSILRLFGLTAVRPPDEPEALRLIAERLEGLPREEAVRLAAFAYVLARVAYSDLRIDDLEAAAMEQIVAREGGLDREAARLAVAVARSRAHRSGGTDDYLVTREYRRRASHADRLQLLHCSFAVAASDASISGAETQLILQIGEELGFDRREVLALRAAWRSARAGPGAR